VHHQRESVFQKSPITELLTNELEPFFMAQPHNHFMIELEMSKRLHYMPMLSMLNEKLAPGLQIVSLTISC